MLDDSIPNIVTDPTRLRQILLNLVSNAIKFTPAGAVLIRGYTETNENGKLLISFEVKDSGIGIPESQTEKVFEVFVQADGSMTRKFGGTGLGLSLSRTLARELGGDLTILRTRQGKGSTFKLSILDQPEKRSEAPSNMPRKNRIELSANVLDGVRVLVVDDAPDNRHLILRYLTKRGAAVETAENGLVGYDKAMTGSYDIVIMDIQMPVMDGYTATDKLRTDGFEKPIIALTAHAMPEVRQKCLSMGCTDHLPKPIDQNLLIEKVARYTDQLLKQTH